MSCRMVGLDELMKRLEEVGYYIDEGTLRKILAGIYTRPRFLIFSGPPGTGKTSLAVLLGCLVNGGERVMGEEDGDVVVVEDSTIELQLGEDESLSSLKFSPDGRYLVGEIWRRNSEDIIKIWNINSWEEILDSEGDFRAFSPDGRYLIIQIQNYIDVLDTGTWDKIITLQGTFEAFSFDGKYLVAVNGNWEEGYVTKVWDIGTWNETITLDGLFRTFSPSIKYIITESDEEIILWEVGTWRIVSKLKSSNSSYIVVSPGEGYIAGKFKREIRVWKIQESGIWENVKALYAKDVSFSLDGKYMALEYYGCDITSIWATNNLKGIIALIGRYTKFDPNNQYILTQTFQTLENIIKIWDINTWKNITDISGEFLAFSPDGKYLAIDVGTWYDPLIKIYKVGTWEHVATLNEKFETFSPDGKYIALKTGDNRITIYRLDHTSPTHTPIPSSRTLESLIPHILNNCPYVKLVRVRPEWTNPMDILGYKDFQGKFRKGVIYDFLKRANEDKDHLYFLILDEMNLSHPEHYLSDIISAMESGGKIYIDEGYEIDYPENLVIIGTINRDETTQNLSPRLLSRALNVELRSKWELVKEDEELRELFKGIDEELKKAGLGVGYREFKRCLEFIRNYGGDRDTAVDEYLLSKVVPRIRGLKEELGEVLDNLIDMLEKYPRTRKALEKKREILERRGFVE